MRFSINGALVLKPYKNKKELEVTETVTGFAGVANKTGIEVLELLVDTFHNIGDNVRKVPKGSKIYFKRELLDTIPWSKSIYKTEEFPEGFIVGYFSDAVFIEEKESE